MHAIRGVGSLFVIAIVLSVNGYAQEQNLQAPTLLTVRAQHSLPRGWFLEAEPLFGIADQRRALSTMAFRSGDYGKSFLLSLDMASAFWRLPNHDGMFWKLGFKDIIKQTESSLVLVPYDTRVCEALRFPEGLDPELAQALRVGFCVPPDGRPDGNQDGMEVLFKPFPFELGELDSVCGTAKSPFNTLDYLYDREEFEYLLTGDNSTFSMSSSEYRRQAYSNAARSYLRTLHLENITWPNFEVEGIDGLRSSAYFCSANAFFRAGERAEGLRNLCSLVAAEPDSESLYVLVNSIRFLAGNSSGSVRGVCQPYLQRPQHPRRLFPFWYYPRRKLAERSEPALRRLAPVEHFVLALARQHNYGAASVVFLGIGVTILSSLNDQGWESVDYHRSRECFEPECNERIRESLNWLFGAANTLLLDGGLERVFVEFRSINQAIPAFSKMLGGSFMYDIYGLYVDPGRSLIREGIDVEMLSTWTSPPVLYDNFPDLKSDWFPVDAVTRQANELFAKGQKDFGDRSYLDSTTDFLAAAQSLEMNCETDLCRDALWVWRAHAVWNAVTSLRQMGNPVKACEEAKKFVILAGEGHQKSAAADVEDALCGDLPEHVPDRDELN